MFGTTNPRGRRDCLFAFLLLCTSLLRAEAEAPRPTLGVIRWDGYSGSPVWTQQQEFGFLKPAQFHWRLPWFVELTGSPDAPFRFNPKFEQTVVQEITDQEIAYAVGAGIDYWAFCHFGKHKGDGWQLRNSLQAYLDSAHKASINFALICLGVHIGAGVGDGAVTPEKTWDDWVAYVAEYSELVREATYQRVLAGRPLFYIMGPKELSINLGDEDYATDKLQEAVAYLRAQFQQAGVGNPYIVGMNSGGIWAAKYVDEAGLDAVSAYYGGFGGTVEGTPFRDLWGHIKADFLENPDMGGGARKVVVPLVSGCDQSPRHADRARYLEPEPGELTDLVTSAFDYVAAHSAKCESNTVLIYAWNEHSEGGFICPIIGEDLDPATPDTRRLDEIGRALAEWRNEERHDADADGGTEIPVSRLLGVVRPSRARTVTMVTATSVSPAPGPRRAASTDSVLGRGRRGSVPSACRGCAKLCATSH